jgi:hypothetical protein
MNTPTHALLNLKLFNKKANKRYFIWIVLGGLLPDFFTGIYAVSLYFLGYSSEQIWEEFYFSDWLFPWISLTHSLWLFPLLSIVFLYLWKRRSLVYLFASWSLHAFVDFWLHARDAYMHFWPLSNYRFFSPVSYWDPQYYGREFGLFETILYWVLLVYFYAEYWKEGGRFAKFGLVMATLWGILVFVVGFLIWFL